MAMQRQDDPLAHAAAELVRVGLQPENGIGNVDRLEQVDGGSAAAGHRPVRTDDIELPPDGEDGIEMLPRVGKGQRQLFAAQRRESRLILLEQISPPRQHSPPSTRQGGRRS